MIHKFFVDCVKLFHSRRISERNYFYKHISTSAYNNFKVAIMGGAGSIGQYLGLMLLRDCFVSRLALYDVSKTTPGVAEDLSHINSGVCVEGGFVGENQIHMALCGANVVVITAGKRRKAGMTQDDLFKSNAKIIVDTCLAINKCCPLALIAIVTNPVNSLVPVAVELLTSFQKTYCQKIFGVTTLDLVRASTFTAQQYGLKPECVFVPVIGGHSGSTIIPLLSQCKPPVNVFAEEQRLCVTEMTQEAGKHVVKAKAKTGSATLSTAVATARFVNSLLKGLAVNFKVAVLGAAGGVGRPLAMLLKQNAMVTDLALYDKLKSISKVAMDVSHINTSSPVMGLCRKAELCQVLDCASIVVITIAESPQKTLEKTFKKNADVIFELLKAVVVYSPSAFIVIVTDPVNAITPFVSKYMKKACVYDRRRIFGMTTLDVVRASTIVGQMNCVNPLFQYVPVVGGNKKATIVPLLSQSVPPFCNSNIEGTIALIRAAAANVIKKKCGKGSATLSVAYATNRFVNSLLMGLCGEPTKEFAFVRTDDKDNPFFASPIILGKCGIEKILPIGNVTEYEEQLIKVAKLFLKGTKRMADQYIKQRERSIPLVVK